MGGEEARVEALGDLADGRADGGERGADGGCGLLGQHEASSGLAGALARRSTAGTVLKLASEMQIKWVRWDEGGRALRMSVRAGKMGAEQSIRRT
ncbi:hypothetical protein ALMP_02000 [Streptomyces sp. A012304]|nr:hypothetical protein ALMP_02000 [Streptomyces sp. A012304]